ncbi:hypothetical protein STEG23_013486, partial [Scotinomys teguina]
LASSFLLPPLEMTLWLLLDNYLCVKLNTLMLQKPEIDQIHLYALSYGSSIPQLNMDVKDSLGWTQT